MFLSKSGAYPIDANFYSGLLALPTNNSLGCKDLSGTNLALPTKIRLDLKGLPGKKL